MNIKTTALSLLAALFLISCSSDTSNLGSTILPKEDLLVETAQTFYATSKSIAADNELLSRSSDCYIGRFTDPETATSVEASYLTQFNCVENFQFPDSVYGLPQFHFPADMRPSDDEKAIFASLRLYFTSLLGDKTNNLKIEVWPVIRALDPEQYYTSDLDPAQFCDFSGKPWARLNVSPTDFAASDSSRNIKDYYNNLYFSLPDSIAYNILQTYYSEGGKEKFSSTPEFIENICKGCYVRCIAGDGTLLRIDKSVLEIHFRHIQKNKSTNKYELASSIAEFTANSEVMQVNCFKNDGIDELIANDKETYLKTPYGILTEVELPIDEISSNAVMVNSASVSFRRINPNDQKYQFNAPSSILLIKKDCLKDFFKQASSVDNISSFYTNLDVTYNEYKFNNISRMILECISNRALWMEKNGWTEESAEGKAAYEKAFPDWNKVILVPVKSQTDANSNIIYFNIDLDPSSARLKGGINGEKIAIKTIKANF